MESKEKKEKRKERRRWPKLIPKELCVGHK